MPYTVDSPDLPSNVKALAADLKAQWVEVFNSAIKSCEDEGGADCEASAMMQANGVIKKRQEENALGEAEWDTAYVNNLPDGSFALIMPGGEKDESNKTTPRSLRKLPYKDASGAIDLPHLRNALARLEATDAPAELKAKARAALNKAADENLKTRQQEAQKMKILEALAAVSEASSEIAGAVSELRAAVEALGLDESQSADVMAALATIEELIAPMEPEEPEMDTETPATETQPVAEALSESLSSRIEIVEAETPASPRDPLAIRMRLIKAGPGNPQDKHYYPGDVLKRDAHVFEGVKMYTTPHDESIRSEENEKAIIQKIVDYEEDGSPIAEVVIFDPDLAEKTRNRAKVGHLDSLECSILAKGTAKEGDIDGQTYNVVESIESAQAVDFVPKAGAGGQAQSIVESEAGTPDPSKPPEPEPKPLLEKERVLTVLRETSLPKPSQERLANGEYPDESALHEAVLKETAYIKEISGSGTPLGAGLSSPAAPEPETAEQRRQRDAAWYSELRERCGLSAQ